MTASLFLASEHVQGGRKYHCNIKESELSQKLNLCLWGAWNFPPKNLRPEKMCRLFATKMARGCADSPKLNFSHFIWIKVIKRYCSFFNALSLMTIFSLTLLTIHYSTQLNRKTITFSFLYKKIRHFHLISLPGLTLCTQTNDDQSKLKNNPSALRLLWVLEITPLVHTKQKLGLGWRIFYILTSEDIDYITNIMVGP